ncbi:Phosphohistidine phosphatase SixA [Enhygromyxa salina]|uniref:Phosphohistidine phosphatase SixA n=1 Tax=Enhygromyxa salina TaxID=215803 RepID=A0A0C2DAR6_9BACT|nr:phosphoglycerate mutase family protein [Enhygromyxa salina]KIG18605.1 Phosphohistidine phosphatase SixA [Enhygromyxa salina]
MFLTLVRHGDALAPNNNLGDDGRCLSATGRNEARATGRALAERGVAPTHAWSSPLVRAIQTSELIVGALGFAGVVEARDDVYPDSRPHALFGALASLPANADVLVVGHMPYMPAAASALLGFSVGRFATGAAFRIAVTGAPGSQGGAALQWRWVGQFVD